MSSESLAIIPFNVMTMNTALLLVFLLSSSTPALAETSEEKVTPVQKVLELLQGMLEKGKKEKHDEAVQYAAFKQFCDDTKAEKTRLIAEANELIEKLKADIEKYTQDAAQLAEEIAQHEADIAAWNSDIKAATKVRDGEGRLRCHTQGLLGVH